MTYNRNGLRALGKNSFIGRFLWYYGTTEDALATVMTAAHIEAEDTDLAVDDLVIIQATDGCALAIVTAIAGTAPNGATIKGIDASAIFVNTAGITSAGGATPDDDLEAWLDYLATRLNLKVQGAITLGAGGFPLHEGTGPDPDDELRRVLFLRRIAAGTGIDIREVDSVLTIEALGSDPTPPPDPTPDPTDNRSDAFNTGTRRLHVGPGSFVAPIDGTTVSGPLQFTNLQTALDDLEAGDVLTIAAGDYFFSGGISCTGLGSAAGDPIWIAEEQLGTVRILRVKEAAFNGTQAWTNRGGGRYSAAIGDTYLGVWDGNFLPKYSSIANLDAVSVNGKNKPRVGICFSGGELHIRLPGFVNPNGQEVILPNAASSTVIDFNNCDNIIWDGCELIGGGEQAMISFDSACANPVIRHVRSATARFLCRIPSNTIVTWCNYALADFLKGGKAWMRTVIGLNGNEPAAFFEIVKGDLAVGGNAKYEGGIAVGTATVHTNCEFSFNRYVGVFDGERFGEFASSTSHHNVGDECGDDFQQFEDDNNSNDGDGNRSFYNRIRNNHGPIFSHQNETAATHDVYRNVVEITDPAIFRPENLFKMIRTHTGSTIRVWQNYFEMLATSGTRNIWYPFSTPTATNRGSGGAMLSLFINNIINMPGGVSSNSGGVPDTVGNNVVVGPASTNIYLGTGSVNVGNVEANLLLDGEYVPQAGSPAIGAGRSLPGGLPTDPTTIDGSRESGAFESNEDPGPIFPRSFGLQFDQTLPPRWTSPGA